MLKSSRGGSDINKIVDAIEDREFDQACEQCYQTTLSTSFHRYDNYF